MEANLQQLRQLCSENKNSYEISQIIESLHDREDYAKYHYQEYKRLSDEKESVYEAFKLATSFDQDYIKHRRAMKANIIACMQNMHIIHDLLGFLIFKVLDLKINNNNIYIRTVINFLKSLNSDRHATLLKLLYKLAGEDNNNQPIYFEYLSDIVNHSKHKYTIEPKFNTNFDAKIERAWYFDNFTHRNKTHEKMDAIFFINTEYSRESNLTIQIENELINILKKEKKETREMVSGTI